MIKLLERLILVLFPSKPDSVIKLLERLILVLFPSKQAHLSASLQVVCRLTISTPMWLVPFTVWGSNVAALDGLWDRNKKDKEEDNCTV